MCWPDDDFVRAAASQAQPGSRARPTSGGEGSESGVGKGRVGVLGGLVHILAPLTGGHGEVACKEGGRETRVKRDRVVAGKADQVDVEISRLGDGERGDIGNEGDGRQANLKFVNGVYAL